LMAWNLFFMTGHDWTLLSAAIRSKAEVPEWLKEQAELSYLEISHLPPLDRTIEGTDSIPSVEEKLLNAAYLSFLAEQIKLKSRGPEWTRILQQRLIALTPFVGQKVLTAMFFRKPFSATLRLAPGKREIIQIEID
jgi:hypothetical protein